MADCMHAALSIASVAAISMEAATFFSTAKCSHLERPVQLDLPLKYLTTAYQLERDSTWLQGFEDLSTIFNLVSRLSRGALS